MLITAAMTSPPCALPATTTTAPIHTIRAHELKSVKDFMAEYSPTNENTVLIWEMDCHARKQDIDVRIMGTTNNARSDTSQQAIKAIKTPEKKVAKHDRKCPNC